MEHEQIYNSKEKCLSPEEWRPTWLNILREIPVSVNNYYGDPLLQWKDTCSKLDDLAGTKHRGPVGIITKGVVTDNIAESLQEYRSKGLNTVVLVSISEMPQFEKIGMEHRYKNLAKLNEYGIQNIAYIRPMTPPYNTGSEVIDHIFEKVNYAGGQNMVISGFRGDENIIRDMSPGEVKKWVLRVKFMTEDVYSRAKEKAREYRINLFTHTSCAVNSVLGIPDNYNPYYYSPNLVKCFDLNCNQLQNCKPVIEPKKGSLELLNYLGLKATLKKGDPTLRCFTAPDHRLDCPSCCTTCYKLDVPRINIDNDVNLGTLIFARFVTGMLASKEGVHDTGAKDIADVILPNFPEIKFQCLNSWWPIAHVGDKCFDCEYCIERYYKDSRKDFGFPPAKLLERAGL